MIFLTGIMTGLLFLILQTFPPLGFILPIYKIKKLGALGIKEHLIVNILAVGVITIVDYKLALVYLAFLVPEFGYYFILGNFKNLKAFDRIVIVAIATSVTFFLVYSLIFKYSGVSFEMIREIYEKNVKLKKEDLESAFIFIKNYSYYLAFVYSFVIVFAICLFFNRKSFIYWEISYLWIIPYIALFFLKHFDVLQGIYVENGLKILTVIFIPYGMKSIYLSLLSFTKMKFLCRIAVLLILLYNPQLFFIYGVISSGGEKKL